MLLLIFNVSNLHIYAAMRGQTLEEFQKTRNAPSALYSVAGNDAGDQQQNWDPQSSRRSAGRGENRGDEPCLPSL